jgi:SAM-dependent methyltransferase
MDGPSEKEYQARVSEELNIYRDCLHVHELPDIFHYWSNSKVRPRLEAFGFSSPTDMFKKYLEELCQREPNGTPRFISIGSGNCDLEIALAQHLLSQGHSHFVIDCLDLNPAMLERGRVAASQAGVETQIQCLSGDFNQWEPAHEYDGVVACQALHHVVNLEGLFRQIRRALKPHGLFLISDMVGRNGHQRWPEALQIVQEFWRELPQPYRFNKMLRRHEESYVNWDCSTEGFEGVRSQDILTLLLKNFYFRLFVAYGNVIDPFVDRAFGHNFNATAEWDRNFIDRVHQRDEEEMLAGRIKPVHMVAVLAKEAGEPMLFHPPFTPGFCVRWPDPAPEIADVEAAPDANAVLQTRLNRIEHQLRMVADSRWLKLGRRFGLGPKLR